MFDPNIVYKQNIRCPQREIETGLAIISPDGEMAHALEGMALFIWNQMDGENNLNAILASILDTYDVKSETAQHDLEVFVQKLSDMGLIVR